MPKSYSVLPRLGSGYSDHHLGMAETTPGPLIMVLQFVGFMGGTLSSMLAGTLGVWVHQMSYACLMAIAMSSAE